MITVPPRVTLATMIAVNPAVDRAPELAGVKLPVGRSL